MGELAQPKFLVVEDDATVGHALSRIIRAYGSVSVADSVQRAREKLPEAAWSGFVIDLGLPDGSGLDVLADVRTAFPGVPAMLLTGRVESEAINAAFDLRAQYVVKPVDTPRMRRFLADATAVGRPVRPPENLHEAVAQMRALLGRRADTRTRYAVGALVATIKSHPGQFGPGAVAAVAGALGQREPTLYRHAWVAETFAPDELETLLARTGPHGHKVTWSHLVTLSAVPSAELRAQLVDRLLEDGLSVRGLASLVAEVAGVDAIVDPDD